jgi:hypothetical protein
VGVVDLDIGASKAAIGQSGHHFGARRQNSMKAASEPT